MSTNATSIKNPKARLRYQMIRAILILFLNDKGFSMNISNLQKQLLRSQIVEKLSTEREIQKIVLFGSFVTSEAPSDIDIAVFQDSDEKYLTLSMKYRKLMRDITKIISVDVLPVKQSATGSFLSEIESGETIYER